MEVGRYYIDNSGQELRYIGTTDDSQSIGIFSDGERTFQKPLSEFENMPKERKLFGFFGKGGITANDLLEARSFFGEEEWKKLKKQDKINSARYLKRTGKIGYKKGGKLPEPEESQEYYASMQYDKGGETKEMDFMSEEFESKVKDIFAKPKSTPKKLPATKRTKNAFGLLSFEQLSEIFNVELFGLNERETEKMLEELRDEWNNMSENERIGFLNANGIKYADGGMTMADWLAKKMSEVTHYDVVVVAKSKPSGREGWLSSVTYETKVEARSQKEAEEKAEREFKKLYTNESIDYINAFADTSHFMPSMYAEGGDLKEDFLEDMQELHNDIKEITLRDGSKISHEELMEAHFMAEDEDRYGSGGYTSSFTGTPTRRTTLTMADGGKVSEEILKEAFFEGGKNGSKAAMGKDFETYEDWIKKNKIKSDKLYEKAFQDGGKSAFNNMKGRDFQTFEEWKKENIDKMADGGELDTFSNIFKEFGFEQRKGAYGVKKFYKRHNNTTYYGTVDSGGYNRPILLEKFETASADNDYKYGQVLYEGTSVTKLIEALKENGFEEKMADGGEVTFGKSREDKFYNVKESIENGKVVFRGKMAEGGEIVTDRAEVQKIKNSIQEGELILRAGKSYGRKLSADELESIRESVNRSRKKIGLDETIYAKGGKTPVVVRTQFEEEEFEYEDGGILADMSNRDKAKVFAFLDEYTKSNEVSTWWDYFGYTKEQADDIEKGWAKSRGYMGKGGNISKYDDGAFAGYKMNRGGKDWFIIKHTNYDTGKTHWNVYTNSIDGENWVDGFKNKYSAIYYIKNIYTNPDWQ
jgi:hypothetical protein